MTTARSLMVFAALWLAACSGSTTKDPGGSGGDCSYGGKSYSAGDSFPSSDGCNTCSCAQDGQVACTLLACVDGCSYDGKSHQPGESFPATDGCNQCTCNANGSVSCTEKACATTCEYQGKTYVAGQSFPAGDGCNECFCQDNGKVSCTLAICAQTCSYAGKEYKDGESFPSLDGCNTCTCTSGGVGCTKKACACDPSKEWWRKYYTPAECKAGVQCPGYTTPFTNSCGCGCEQDASCPEWFDCMPPSPCDPDQMKQCPYSGVAY
ncbi:MAG: hypothetical protein KC776_14940 [Myxococcales bacterium]|nr:hypothetical protein [Myxococcales bacterium]MCB9579807.1 hypothetical protein [Polyangiaceae bacterium]